MRRFRIPHHWKEVDCRKAIDKLLDEGKSLYKQDKLDDAAQCIVAVLTIMDYLPTIKKKEYRRVAVNGKLKKDRIDKKEKELEEYKAREKKEEVESKTPFDNEEF